MKYTQQIGKLLKVQALSSTAYSFDIYVPAVAGAAKAGQFVMVTCGDYMLRRPISLAGFDAKAGTIRLVFEIRGAGTAWLAGLQKGAAIDVIGPLGNGFPCASGKTVLVGGGIGTPPLLPIAEVLGGDAVAVLGFRNADAVILQDDYTQTGAEVLVCTDDGSAGFHGNTAQALGSVIEGAEAVYTCGPKVMMQAVAAVAAEKGVPCFVSMEERMGCGFGACVGCAVPVRDAEGNVQNKRVCAEGPVFRAEEVFF